MTQHEFKSCTLHFQDSLLQVQVRESWTDAYIFSSCKGLKQTGVRRELTELNCFQTTASQKIKFESKFYQFGFLSSEWK